MLKADLVEVSFLEEDRGVWDFAGKLCKGTKFYYEAKDYNYHMRNAWQFVVQVPDAWTKGNYINVKPMVIPNRKVWAGLDRRAIGFQRATIGRHLGRVYAKLAIADVRGEKARLLLSKDSKQFVPKWLKEFSPLQKQRVTRSLANDGEHLVAVVDRDDHAKMIKLFLALKPWVLDRGYDPAEAQASAVRRRRRERRARLARLLKGKVIAVTGRLAYGTRDEVYGWLQSLGAKFSLHTTSKTDLLIVGAHPHGEDRVKVQQAKKIGVPMLTEAQFRRTYAL
jgi:hypothetical protein